MDNPIVTLTTDWGDRDYYAAMVKGRLYSLLSGITVVDLSHHQAWNDINVAAAMVRYGCMSFAEGSVHIVDVGVDQSQIGNNPQPAFYRRSVVAKYKSRYFVCSNRRILEQAFTEPSCELVMLPEVSEYGKSVFLAYHQYCDVVRLLLQGNPLSSVGEETEPLRLRPQLSAQTNGDKLETMVVYRDSYGNVNLNISYDDFEALRAGRRFRMYIGPGDRFETVDKVSLRYCDVHMGEMALTVSSSGQLQIAVNKDSAAKLVGLGYATKCTFVFE